MSRQAQLTRLNVAAGILKDASGRVLIAERLGDGPFHGLWEFPGGKIGFGESAVSALGRELAEEIGIDIREYRHFMSLTHDYPDRSVSIDFFLISDWSNDPSGQEGQALKWLSPSELDSAEMLPADKPVVDELKRMGSDPFNK